MRSAYMCAITNLGGTHAEKSLRIRKAPKGNDVWLRLKYREIDLNNAVWFERWFPELPYFISAQNGEFIKDI